MLFLGSYLLVGLSFDLYCINFPVSHISELQMTNHEVGAITVSTCMSAGVVSA